MAIKIIGRDGNVRKKNDYSSWKSSGGSTLSLKRYNHSNIPSPVHPSYAHNYIHIQQKSKRNPDIGNVYRMPTKPSASKNTILENSLPRSFKSGYNYIDKGNQFTKKPGTKHLAPKEHFSYSFMRGAETVGSRVTDKLNTLVMRAPEPNNNPSANLITKGAKRIALGISDVPGQFIDMGGKIPYGVETIIRDPHHASKNIGVGAGVMAASMKQGITTDPLRFAGQMVVGPKVGGKALKVGKGVAGKTAGFADISVPVPSSSGSGMARYKGVYVKSPLGLKPVAGLKDGKPVLGSPSFNIKSGYTPKTSVELAITKPSIKRKMTPAQASQWEAGFRVVEALKDINPRNTKQVNLKDIKYIPPKARPVVEKWIAENPQHQIYGSATQKAQLGTGRTPADLDIGVVGADSARFALANKLSKSLGRDNVKIDGAAVSVKQNGGWHHAVDIHELADMSKGTMDFGFETHSPLKIGSQRQTRIGEQLERKAASILVPKGKGFGPKPHRIKDIGDFMSAAEGLIEVGKQSKNPVTKLKAKKGERALQAFKGERPLSRVPDPLESFFDQTRTLMSDTSAEFVPLKKNTLHAFEKDPVHSSRKSTVSKTKTPASSKKSSGKEPMTWDEYLNKVNGDDLTIKKLNKSPSQKNKPSSMGTASKASRKYPSIRKAPVKNKSRYPPVIRSTGKTTSKGYPGLSTKSTSGTKSKYPSTSQPSEDFRTLMDNPYPASIQKRPRNPDPYPSTPRDRPSDPYPPITSPSTTPPPYPPIIKNSPSPYPITSGISPPPTHSPVSEEPKKPPKFPLDKIDDPLAGMFKDKKGRGKKTVLKMKTASEMMQAPKRKLKNRQAKK